LKSSKEKVALKKVSNLTKFIIEFKQACLLQFRLGGKKSRKNVASFWRQTNSMKKNSAMISFLPITRKTSKK
jgi:hypothetical protein